MVGRFHSNTPLFPVIHLETGGRGAPIWKGKGCLACVASVSIFGSRPHDLVGTSIPDWSNREMSRNQAWKQKLNKSVSFTCNYYFFEWTAKMMVMFRRQLPKWDQNPWFVPETTSILPTFAYRSYPLGFQHLPFKAVSRSATPCQVSYSLKFDLSTQYFMVEMLYIE